MPTINNRFENLTLERLQEIYDLIITPGSIGLAVGVTPITGGAVGRVLFEGAGNVLQESSNLFWDDTNNRLGIGTATPAFSLDVNGSDARINTLTIGLGSGQIFNNTAVGTQALLENTTGAANTAVGYFALENNTTGGNNSAFGYASLLSNLSTSNHTAIGLSSLRNITSGSYNTALGTNAGRYIADGTTNLTTSNVSLFLGSNTKALANSQTNQIVIGYDATGLGSNSVVLGNSSITLTALRGNVLINTTTDAGYKLDVNGTARMNSINGGGTSTLTIQSHVGATAALTVQFASNQSATSLDKPIISAVGTFNPTSGSATFAGLSFTATINQTGTATGISRGLYINPTITAAADFRAIETTAGNVLFGASGTGFFWDNTNSRLGIGTASPLYRFHLTGGQAFLKPTNNSDDALSISNQGFITFRDVSDVLTARLRAAVNQFQFQDASFNIKTLISLNNGFTYINNGGGNVGIGTTTDAGFKLDVNGTARTGDLTIGTLGASNVISFGGGVNNTIFRDVGEGSLNFRTTFSNSINFRFRTNSDLPNANTTGTNVFLSLPIGYAPTSGTGTWTQLSMTPTINQTGGANGITRGLYINPTITSATDFRAIDVVRGKICLNSTSGNTLIGTTTDIPSSKLTVESTTQGFLPPRMTTTQKNAIASPAAGLVVYDTTLGKLCVRTASAWETITSA